MRLAYIISAYKLPDLLVRLVHKLQSENAIFFIHVDKKSSSNVFRRMREGLTDFPNVYFLKRHNCYWGGFGHVQATLKGIRELVKRDILFDYVILLTGQDYPLKTNSSIENFFLRNEDKSFINYTPLPCEGWDVMDRIERWYFMCRGMRIGFPLNVKGERLRSIMMIKKIINLFLPTKRDFLPNMKPYGGSSYWNLSREAIYYIFRYVNDNPDFVRFFKSVAVSDELFFQTLLLNSHLKDKIIDDNLRYIDWSDGERRPAILGQEDFRALRSSSKLFARKFDTTVDSHILDIIDKHLVY